MTTTSGFTKPTSTPRLDHSRGTFSRSSRPMLRVCIVDCCHWATGSAVIQLRARTNSIGPLLVVVPSSPVDVAIACGSFDPAIVAVAVDAETPAELVAGIASILSTISVRVIILDVSCSGLPDLQRYADGSARVVREAKIEMLAHLIA